MPSGATTIIRPSAQTARDTVARSTGNGGSMRHSDVSGSKAAPSVSVAMVSPPDPPHTIISSPVHSTSWLPRMLSGPGSRYETESSGRCSGESIHTGSDGNPGTLLPTRSAAMTCTTPVGLHATANSPQPRLTAKPSYVTSIWRGSSSSVAQRSGGDSSTVGIVAPEPDVMLCSSSCTMSGYSATMPSLSTIVADPAPASSV